jgi:XapX domain-containing protein
MIPYLISLAVGLFVGMLYGLLDVKSPAPPFVALVGLKPMLSDAKERIGNKATNRIRRQFLSISQF